MIRSILVGLNCPQADRSVVDLGIQWARQSQALLVGLGVVRQPAVCAAEAVPPGTAEFDVLRERVLADAECRRIREAQHNFGGLCENANVAFRVLEVSGPPIDCILAQGQRHDVILLGLQRWMQAEGHQSSLDPLDAEIKNSPRPVVAVPERPSRGTSVIVAYDGSVQAARTLQAFQGLGIATVFEVHLVCVHADEVEARSRLDPAIQYLHLHGTTVHPHAIVTAGDPASTLLRQIAPLNAGLLVMGAFGQKLPTDDVIDSVTRKVLADSVVPVFLCH